MAIKTVRIHPAIGIARLGNSPTEFFIGPERPLDRTPAAGGYKDADCRIKRQAARFRLFAYDEADALVKELTVADGDIKWTAHLANRKAAGLRFGAGLPLRRNDGVDGAARDKLVIDPGARSVTGAGQQALFDSGTFELPATAPKTVPLGELRTDTQGHLLVLGGLGTSGSPKGTPIATTFDNDDWHDDISDGPITASIKIGAKTFDAEAAWVIVAPPKYSPPLDHVVNLYDRLQQFFIDQGLLPAFADLSPSYTKYIYPILHRALQVAWVEDVPGWAHKWVHPVTADAMRIPIFNKLRKPDGTGSGDMPQLKDYTVAPPWVRLTDTQYKIMEMWKNNTFTNDWAGEPGPDLAITPAGLDMAALENCVGSAFYPGIEAGQFLISDKTLYSRAFRLNPAKVKPGDVTARMALPWQTDFWACQDKWWPPARPNLVRPEGGGAAANWAASVPDRDTMVAKWADLGFVLRSGDEYLLTEVCASSFVHLLTPQLLFKDIPRGPMGMSRKAALAIVFEVRSPGGPVKLEFKAGPIHPRLQRLGAVSVSVGPTAGSQIVHARLWLTYETGTPGESITDTVTVSQSGTSQEWTIKLSASTVERKKSAAALVLDRSGSMDEDMGGGQTRIQGLREAAQIFVDVMLQDDGVSIVRFNQAAQELKPVTLLGSPADPFDTGRSTIKASITGPDLNPAGQTSIGDGIVKGRTALNAAAGFDVKSLLVFTDGKENHAPFIADVAAQLNERTYAVGLGTPLNISAAGLQTISGNSGGYFLMTGAVTLENRFLLQKYFLQILAGISNAEIALDPQGELAFGESHEIPFWITEADAGMDVILLSPYSGRIRFRLKSPLGEILDPARAAGGSDALFVQSGGVSYYRVRLPIELFLGRPDSAGRWHALLDFGQPGRDPNDPGFEDAQRHGEPVEIANAQAVAAGAPFRAVNPALAVGGAFTPAVRVEAQTSFRVPYSVLVHTYSDLRLRANASQDTLAPGARVTLSASLLLYGAPFTTPAQVWADITRPDGSTFRLDYTSPRETEFEAAFNTGVTGVYAIRVQAASSSPLGHSFRREMTLTAVCRIGADPAPAPPGPGQALCELLECGLRSGALSPEWIQRLRQQGIDIMGLLQCICQGSKPTGDSFPDA